MPEVERLQCMELMDGNPANENKCVFEKGHEGPHSWDKEALAEIAEDNAERSKERAPDDSETSQKLYNANEVEREKEENAKDAG